MQPHMLLLATIAVASSISGLSQVADDASQSDEVKRLSVLYLESVVNDRRLDLLSEVFSVDYVFHEMDGRDSYPIRDSTLAPFLKKLFTAFPDLHYTLGPIIGEGEIAAVYCTATGTHKAEFLGIPESGNKITFKEIFIFRIRNNRIVEGWGVVDVLGLREQMKKNGR